MSLDSEVGICLEDKLVNPMRFHWKCNTSLSCRFTPQGQVHRHKKLQKNKQINPEKKHNKEGVYHFRSCNPKLTLTQFKENARFYDLKIICFGSFIATNWNHLRLLALLVDLFHFFASKTSPTKRWSCQIFLLQKNVTAGFETGYFCNKHTVFSLEDLQYIKICRQLDYCYI